jgi:hypothetical protein
MHFSYENKQFYMNFMFFSVHWMVSVTDADADVDLF